MGQKIGSVLPLPSNRASRKDVPLHCRLLKKLGFGKKSLQSAYDRFVSRSTLPRQMEQYIRCQAGNGMTAHTKEFALCCFVSRFLIELQMATRISKKGNRLVET